jgi:fructokinase
MSFLIGFDIGGTKTEAVLLKWDADTEHNSESQVLGMGHVIARERIATDRHLGYESLVERVSALAEKVVSKCGLQKENIISLGFAIPGSVHPETLCMINGNTLILKDKPFPYDVQNKLGWQHCSLAAENDANLFALAEALCGAGKQHEEKTKKTISKQTSVGVILGTGFGGGIVVSGDTLKGSRGGAAEIGHFTLFYDGHSCYCGKKGCAEQYLSGTALEALFQSRKYSQIQNYFNAIDIFNLYEQQEPTAVAVIAEYKRNLALALANICTLLDVDFFVLGGGLSKQKILLEGLEAEISRHCFLPDSHPAVYQNTLGDSAGVFGAILIAKKASELK